MAYISHSPKFWDFRGAHNNFFLSLIFLLKKEKEGETLAILSTLPFFSEPTSDAIYYNLFINSVTDVLKAISVRLWEVLIVFN